MTLLIVIVNYRTTALTLDCLRSLQDEVGTVAGTRVVVTDNASGDDSVAHLEAAVSANGWGGWATIQPLEQNGGVAAGNNAARTLSLIVEPGTTFDVGIVPDAAKGLLNVRVGAASYQVALNAGRSRRSATSRSGSANGSGRNRTKSVTENAAVVAPIPSATMMTAVSAKPGVRRSMRTAYDKSWRRMST